MSTKQLLRTVVDGSKLQLQVPAGRVEGYLAGIDDYHLLVVDAQNCVPILVHKASALIYFPGGSTYAQEDRYEELEEIIAPFRDWIRRTVMHQTSTAREQAS